MLARTHGQPATPTTMGKEFAVFAHRLERIAGADRGGRVPRQVQRRDRHVRRAPRRRPGSRTGRRSRASSSTSLGLRLEPAHHPDRVARLAGGAVLSASATPTASCTTSAPTSGPTSRSATSRRSRRRERPVRRRCRTRSTRSGSRTPRPTSSCRARCSTRSPRPSSRVALQRDLTDSTTQRNIGVALGHSLLALDNLVARAGRDRRRRATPSRPTSTRNWEVLGEAIQTVIRAEVAAGRSSIADPYALLKELTRGRAGRPRRARRVRRRRSTSATTRRRDCARSPRRATWVSRADSSTCSATSSQCGERGLAGSSSRSFVIARPVFRPRREQQHREHDERDDECRRPRRSARGRGRGCRGRRTLPTKTASTAEKPSSSSGRVRSRRCGSVTTPSSPRPRTRAGRSGRRAAIASCTPTITAHAPRMPTTTIAAVRTRGTSSGPVNETSRPGGTRRTATPRSRVRAPVRIQSRAAAS